MTNGFWDVAEEYLIFDTAKELDNDCKHIFSVRYKRRKRELLKSLDKASEIEQVCHTGRIKLKYLLLAIIMACVLALTGFVFYYTINGFSFKGQTAHLEIEYLDVENGKINMEELYYLPETDKLKMLNEEAVSVSSVDIMNIVIYSYCGNIVFLEQRPANIPTRIYDEWKSAEPLMIKEHEGFYIERNEETYISWFQDGYVFTVTGNIDKDTAVDMAGSISIKQ